MATTQVLGDPNPKPRLAHGEEGGRLRDDFAEKQGQAAERSGVPLSGTGGGWLFDPNQGRLLLNYFPDLHGGAAGLAQVVAGGGGLVGRHGHQQPARGLRIEQEVLDFGGEVGGELDAGAEKVAVVLEAAGQVPLVGALERPVEPLNLAGSHEQADAA